MYVNDMCALSADEVLLACDAANLLTVSLHNAQSQGQREVRGALRQNIFKITAF